MPFSFCGVADEKLSAYRDEGRTMLCSANAAKRKNDKSQAPHLCLAKAISANAAKRKNDKSHAPHLCLAKAISANAAKGKNDKS